MNESAQSHYESLAPTAPYQPSKERRSLFSAVEFPLVLKGPKPDFQSNEVGKYQRSLPQYHVPEQFIQTLADKNERKKLEQLLAQNLTPANYQQHFTSLLRLEDLQTKLDIQHYDRIDNLLTKHRAEGLFGLKVPGLAEQRPSVLVGDAIYVSEVAWAIVDKQRYKNKVHEGRVWRVELDTIYFKFHNSFHYIDGMKLHIRFSCNRIPIRRSYQAIELLCKNPTLLQTLFPRFFSMPAAFLSSSSNRPRVVPAGYAKYPHMLDIIITVVDNVSDHRLVDEWIQTHVINARCQHVGFDTESARIMFFRNQLAWCQLATDTHCILFYVRGASSLPSMFYRILLDRNIHLYSVGDELRELNKLYPAPFSASYPASSFIDVQQLAHLHFPFSQQLPGLEILAHTVLGLTEYSKDKTLQKSQWGNSQLTPQQKLYAASDAVLARLIGLKCIQLDQSLASSTSTSSSSSSSGVMSGSSVIDAPMLSSPLQFVNTNLDDEQKRAVTSILSERFHPHPFIIFGPAGTGKTTTLIESILQLLKRASISSNNPPIRILAFAPSNAAADLIVERLRYNCDVIQLYRLMAVTRAVDSVPDAVRRFCSVSTVGGPPHFTLPSIDKILGVQLVVSTCISAACLHGLGCEPGTFTHVFMDESGYAHEGEALCALELASTRTKLVLCGDPKQLGALIRNSLAVKYHMEVSLLERLCVSSQSETTSCDNPYYKHPTHGYNHRYIVKLRHNYRSHPAILDQPNRMFYDGELIASADRATRESLIRCPIFARVSNFPFLFHHVVGEEKREATSPSWFNPQEAMVVIDYVKQLLDYRPGGLSQADIGIIAPYRKHVEKLRVLAKERYNMDIKDLKIGSVEEFQGQERKVIIVTTVRSQMKSYEKFDVKYNLGFVKNPKRLNVALTRAKCGLIIVGNAQLLSVDDKWAQLVQYAQSKGAWVGSTVDVKQAQAEALQHEQGDELIALIEQLNLNEEKEGDDDDEDQEDDGFVRVGHEGERSSWDIVGRL